MKQDDTTTFATTTIGLMTLNITIRMTMLLLSVIVIMLKVILVSVTYPKRVFAEYHYAEGSNLLSAMSTLTTELPC